MCVYLHTIFQISSVILTIFSVVGVILLPHPKRTPLESQNKYVIYNSHFLTTFPQNWCIYELKHETILYYLADMKK